MKRRILPLLLVLCLLWLTGCSFDDTSDEDLLQEIYGYYQSGKDKTDAPLTSFALPVLQGQTLDPITCPDGVQQTIGALLYEGLYALDTGFMPQPMLAESCTVSGTTCTITLRGGVTFSDGSAVTASDVVRSLQRAQSSERYGARLAGVSRIAAGSGGTVVLTLAYENQNIAALLDIPIVKAGTETATAPIGTGPYVYTAGEGGSVSLTRNGSWWKGESLPLQTIPLETYKDSDTIAYAFYAREIQLLTCDLTATTPSNVSGSGAYTDADTTVLQYVGVNTSRPLLADPAVRRALSLGIDRAGLVKSFLMGHAAPAQFPVSPVSPLYPQAQEVSYSPDHFAGAMEEAGLRTGTQTQTLTLIVNEENSYKVSMASRIASQLSQYDLRVTVRTMSWSSYTQALRSGNYDLYYAECRLTADWDLTPLLAAGGALNYGGAASDEMTAALTRWLTCTQDEQTEAMDSLCQVFREQSPILPVCFKRTSVLMTQGAVETITPTAANPFYGLKDWKINFKK